MIKQSDDSREGYLSILESQPIIGQRFKDVKRIDRNGGNGNFSLVLTAYDKISKRDVILKFFHPRHNSDPDRSERFQREGRILKRLKGKANILECIEGVCILPVTFTYNKTKIVQEFRYIPLEKAKDSIEHLIYTNKTEPEKFLLFYREMCKGVARLHKEKICHRDLKPGNFFLFPKQIVKLGDFGTAKFLDGSMPSIRVQYDLPVGDFRYIAPELFCRIGIVDRHVFCADLFSLGAILFEMFTREVLTEQIYDKDFLAKMVLLRSSLPQKGVTRPYLDIVDTVASSVKFPDIYAFNDFIPKSIRSHLNSLYKDLTEINFTKRLSDFSTIYRRINICLLTLRNQDKYQKWLNKKKEIHAVRIRKTNEVQ